jgi:hypothetical protein
MYTLDRMRKEFLDQDTAVRQALEATDRDLFDVDSDFEDDFDPRSVNDPYGHPVRREPAKRRSPT